MDSLIEILQDKYDESRANAEKSLALIDQHCRFTDPPIVALITKYQEECDEAIRGMVACAFALKEAARGNDALRRDEE